MAKKTLSTRKPKRFWGAIIGAATQIGGSLIDAKNEKSALENEAIRQRKANNQIITSAGNEAANIHKEFIAKHPELVYGTNKEIQAFGKEGNLETVADGMQVVEAGTHESGNDLERKNDFVEGGEVVTGNAVHSNRIQAYSPAQMSASLGTVLDEIAGVAKRATGGVKGDLERLQVKVTQKIDEVTAKQEAIKDDYSNELDAVSGNGLKPVNAFGDDGELEYEESYFDSGSTRRAIRAENRGFRKEERQSERDIRKENKDDVGFLEGPGGAVLGGVLDLGASSIDNIVNARLLKQTPKVNIPNYYRTKPLETEVDVTEELSSISDQQDKLDAIIDASTGSSNTAIQRKRASANVAVKAENRVFSRKNEAEMQLRNTKHLNEQRIENMNVNLLNNYDDKVVRRENEILSAKSQNISNLSRDLTSSIDKVRMGEFQDEQLANDALKYQDSGVIATTALNGAYDHVSKEDKISILETVKNAGRQADYNALKKRWGI